MNLRRHGCAARPAAACALAAWAIACAATARPPTPPPTTCALYAETFEVFSGPADFDNGAYSVRWCRNGAAVTATSPCLTGNSFRLAGSTQDPVLILSLPAASTCTQVTLEFQYAQALDTGTIVRFRSGSGAAFDCSTAITTSIGSLSTAGGQCITVQHNVVVGTDRNFAWKLDHGANNNAIFIDNVRITLTGCPCDPPHGCCDTGAPGCENASVQSCVCAIDPYCCNVAWDEQCVALVDAAGCGSCGTAPVCLTEFSATFGTFFQSGRVCALFPALFETCEGNGPVISSNNACGGSGDYSMIFSTGFPYSAAVTKCLSLAGAAPAALTFNYTKTGGTLGPRADISVDGGAWVNLWTAPVTFSGGCKPVCLNLTPYVGQPSVRLRFSSGSSVSNGAAIDDILLRRDIACAAHDPCTVGGPGTDSPAVAACTCAIDPYCCETEWDGVCVLLATIAGCAYCPGFCSTEFRENFGDLAPIDPSFDICTLFPGSFQACDPAATPGVSTLPPCGGTNDPAMVFPDVAPGTPPAAAITTCFDLAQANAASLRFSYAKLAGLPGARIEASADLGASWTTIWTAPIHRGGSCLPACVDLSPLLGRAILVLRISAGSELAAGVQLDDLELVRGTACPDCSGLLGDADGSGLVGLDDIAMVITQWGLTNPPPPAPPAPGDVDQNGAVGLSDLAVVIGNWGARCP